MSTDLQRTQVMLDSAQHKELMVIARREKKSVSKLVREMIENEIKLRKRQELARAASLAVQDYTSDADLTAFTSLDGEEFNAQG